MHCDYLSITQASFGTIGLFLPFSFNKYKKMLTCEVSLEGMEFHAAHGFYDWERQQKNYFSVDLQVQFKVKKGSESEDIHSTFNYEIAYAIVKKHMSGSVLLLETLCDQIISSIRQSHPDGLLRIYIKIKKLQPPLPGRIAASTVAYEWKSDE